MNTMPMTLLDALSQQDKMEALKWWETLPQPARQDFMLMWDERSEDSAYYGHVEDGHLIWHDLPLELVGEFVEADKAEMGHDDIKQQLLEFINGHEDVQFFLTARKFHICRAHALARQVVTKGILPADFECPLSQRDCPMRHILAQAPGKSVRFSVRWRATSSTSSAHDSRCDE